MYWCIAGVIKEGAYMAMIHFNKNLFGLRQTT